MFKLIFEILAFLVTGTAGFFVYHGMRGSGRSTADSFVTYIGSLALIFAAILAAVAFRHFSKSKDETE